MPRERFHAIDKSAYLFPDLLSSSDKRKQLEEPVRQWCDFELHATFTFLLEGSQGINSLDLLLLRLNVALTEYGMHQDADKPFPPGGLTAGLLAVSGSILWWNRVRGHSR